MPFQIEALSLISAMQAAVLAAMLWVGVRGAPGAPGRSLSLRAAALAVEALGWGAFAAHGFISPEALLLGGNALNLLAQAMVVVAVRMLLGESLRLRLILGIAVVGWLGVAWLGTVHPDYRLRVLWGTLVIFCNLGLQAQALLNGRSRARSVLLLLLAMSAALLVWRNGGLWFGAAAPTRLGAPGAVNYLYVLFAGMQPLFASVGFLLLYGDVLQRRLSALARLDPLTGVNNRLALDEIATQVLATAARSDQPVGVLMLDADHFKKVNDKFGHAGGDTVLRAVVGTINATLRASDVIGRVGGEEFVVIAPNTNMDELMVLAERIRVTLAATPLTVDGTVLNLTVSIGAALAPPGTRDITGVLRLADLALYSAKRGGRDRVAASGPVLMDTATPA
ncbi:MAG: GGDEF domain-containing protein [Rhodanobacter sp.]